MGVFLTYRIDIIDIPLNLVNMMINVKPLGNVQCHMCSQKSKKRDNGSCQYTFIAPDAVFFKPDFRPMRDIGTAM